MHLDWNTQEMQKLAPNLVYAMAQTLKLIYPAPRLNIWIIPSSSSTSISSQKISTRHNVYPSKSVCIQNKTSLAPKIPTNSDVQVIRCLIYKYTIIIITFCNIFRSFYICIPVKSQNLILRGTEINVIKLVRESETG